MTGGGEANILTLIIDCSQTKFDVIILSVSDFLFNANFLPGRFGFFARTPFRSPEQFKFTIPLQKRDKLVKPKNIKYLSTSV